jgi:hypothetical protein
MASSAWSGTGTVVVPSEVRLCMTMLTSSAPNFGESVLFQDAADLASGEDAQSTHRRRRTSSRIRRAVGAG